MQKLGLLVALLVFPLIGLATVEFGPFENKGQLTTFFYPPHNEFDPNPGIPFAQRITARYGTYLHTEFALKKYNKFYIFFNAFSLFGDSRPQTSYNYRANPIVLYTWYGAGYKITHHFAMGLATGRAINLGKYVLNERLFWSAVYAKVVW